MDTSPRFGFVVNYVEDLAASKRFYLETLGLRVEREAPNFVQFEYFALATDASMDGRREQELYWLGPNVEAAWTELRAKVPVSMELRALPFGKVIGVLYPSGRPRCLLELSAGRPSVAMGRQPNA